MIPNIVIHTNRISRLASMIRLFLAIFGVSLLIGATPKKPKTPSTLTPCNELGELEPGAPFRELEAALIEALRDNETRTPEERARIQDTLDSIFFVDFDSSIQRSAKFLKGRTVVEKAGLAELFGRKSFEHFREAWQFLRQNHRISVANLQKAHAIAMKGISGSSPGEFRQFEVVGLEESGITDQEIENINNNTYTSFTKTGSVRGLSLGNINYPNINNLKPTVWKILDSYRPDLAAKIRKFSKNSQTSDGNDAESLQGELVQALVEQRIERYLADVKFITISYQKALDIFIEATASFQRDLISIHPFADGNGRVTRLFSLYLPFERKGLPPPWLHNTYVDLHGTNEDWVLQVKRGIVATERLYRDVINREHLQLPLSDSPEWLAPFTVIELVGKLGQLELPARPPVAFEKAGTRPSTTYQPRELLAFIDVLFLHDKKIRSKFTKDPEATLPLIQERFLKFIEANSVSSETGEHRLHLVDRDLMTAFSRNYAGNAMAWRAKIDQWFRTDYLVWRGTPYPKELGPAREQQMVDIFRLPNPRVASVATLRRIGESTDPERIRSSAAKDFVNYNTELFEGNIATMANDHTTAEGLYDRSYFFSTSKDEIPAHRFAMGFLSYSETSAKWDLISKDTQDQIGSRVVVGMYPAKTYIDTATLDKIHPQFYNRYPGESEVLGVGVADPDSVMIVKVLSRKMEVQYTYIRSTTDPSIILKFAGDVSAEGAATLEPIKKFKL
jgi:hypothetical protein